MAAWTTSATMPKLRERSPRCSPRKLRKTSHPPSSFFEPTLSLTHPTLPTISKDLPLPPPPPPDKEPMQKRRIFSLTLKRSKNKDLPPSPKKKFTLDPDSERPLPTIPSPITHISIPSSVSEIHAPFIAAYDPSAEGSMTDPDLHGENSRVRRRYSLASAMISRDLSDEVFVQQVERIRRDSAGCEVYGLRGWESGWLDPDPGEVYCEEDSPTFETEYEDDNADKAWSSAVHALLITRDLLRTERNYLASLNTLLQSSPCSTPPRINLPWPSHPPPPLMHTYLVDLITLSAALLHAWEQEPTVVAAARVIVEREEELERVMVGWCGVVGGWFVGDSTDKRRRRRLSKTKFSQAPPPPSFSNSSSSSQLHTSTSFTFRRSSMLPIGLRTPITAAFPTTSPPPSSLKRSSTIASTWRKSMPSLGSLTVRLPSMPPHPPLLSSSSSSDAAALAISVMENEAMEHRRYATELNRSSTFLSLGRKSVIPRSETSLGLASRSDYLSSVSADGHGYEFALPGRSALELERGQNVSRTSLGSGGKKIHSVRELAILPVQRVTRYALLYRDLLKYTTDTSPSRTLLEQAADVAARIAQKCDRAQGNAEFFWISRTSPNK